VVDANLRAATQPGVSGLTANIGCGGRYSLLDLLDAIRNSLGLEQVHPVFEAPRAGDVPHSQADISLARDQLGYEVLVGFQEGVRRTVAWYQAAAMTGTGQRRQQGGEPGVRVG
jgi:nucleoside-diphosphate-sugar epimerase